MLGISVWLDGGRKLIVGGKRESGGERGIWSGVNRIDLI